MRQYSTALSLCLVFSFFSCSPKKPVESQSQSKSQSAPLIEAIMQDWAVEEKVGLRKYLKTGHNFVFNVKIEKSCALNSVFERLGINKDKPKLDYMPSLAIACQDPRLPQNSNFPPGPQNPDLETVISDYGDPYPIPVRTTFPKVKNLELSKSYIIQADIKEFNRTLEKYVIDTIYSEVFFHPGTKKDTRIVKFYFYRKSDVDAKNRTLNLKKEPLDIQNMNLPQRFGSVLAVEIPTNHLKPNKILNITSVSDNETRGTITYYKEGLLKVTHSHFTYWDRTPTFDTDEKVAEANDFERKSIRLVLDHLMYLLFLNNPNAK